MDIALTSKTVPMNIPSHDNEFQLAKLLRRIDEIHTDDLHDAEESDLKLNADLQKLSLQEIAELRDAKGCLDLLDQIRDYENGSTQVNGFETPHSESGNVSSPGECDRYPRKVGRYQIKRLLGQGGFAKVFLADDPILGRQVALKIPRVDVLISEESRQRFEREAKAAATLTHPSIVPVFEAGEIGLTKFIAFAYCPGQTLMQLLAKRKIPLDPREAVAVTSKLAQALAYAHSRGVIHRDIKPSNILIETRHDSSDANVERSLADSVRITDFGLAKLATQAAVDQLETLDGSIIGTPSYMSPEQAIGSDEIGPLSDQFSLGVMLYQMLTGEIPHRKASHLETLNAITDQQPASLRTIIHDLPKDLEAICLKCLEKKPADRYESAFELSADLERWLAGHPVLARRPSIIERFQRWCSRNPIIAFSFAFAIASLATGASIATWKWQESVAQNKVAVAATELASQEAARSKSVLQTFVGTYQSLNPGQGGNPDLKAAQLLKFTQSKIKTQLSDDPAAQAELFDMLADCFGGLGQYDDALDCRLRQHELLSEIHGADAEQVLAQRTSLMMAYRADNQFAKSLHVQQASVDAFAKKYGQDDIRTIEQKSYLGVSLMHAGFPREGIQLERELFSKVESDPDRNSTEILTIANKLALVLRSANHSDEIIELLEPRLPHFETELGVSDATVIAAKQTLAAAFRVNGNSARAVELQKKVVEVLHAKNDELPVLAMSRLASHLRHNRQFEESLQIENQLLDHVTEQFGSDHPKTISRLNKVAGAHRGLSKFSTAIELEQKALKISTKVLGPGNSRTVKILFTLSSLYRSNNEYDASVAAAEQALASIDATAGSQTNLTELAQRNLARAHAAAHNSDAAQTAFENLIELRTQKYGPSNNLTIFSKQELALAQLRAGRFPLTEKLCDEMLTTLDAANEIDQASYAQIQSTMAMALLGQSKFDQAREIASVASLQEKHRMFKAMDDFVEAGCLLEAGKPKDARKRYIKAYRLFAKVLEFGEQKFANSSFGRPQNRYLLRNTAIALRDLCLELGQLEKVGSWQTKIDRIAATMPAN